MCGIAGFIRQEFPEAGVETLRRMALAMAHRGPDAAGEYIDQEIGLAHRRLSILDLSADGNQPMHSSCGRHTIVFNGEIYNFLELRREFEAEGMRFRTRTDTEVLLALYARLGEGCLDRLNGMFAFALWDRRERTLFLARDRIGKKPLYYFQQGERFAFASELKALLELPGVMPEVEPTAIADYLKYLYVPAPKTIFRHCYQLLPGYCLRWRAGTAAQPGQWWDVDFSRGGSVGIEQAAEELLALVDDSTRRRTLADVPLGAFLSGGVDSSAVVALMARAGGVPVRTCSIGFNDRDHDETPYAREVAGLFGTDHREYVVEANLPQTVLQLPRFFDEPFADSSAVPTFHVSRLARQDVTVALAGDGGDESFGGYQKYSVELREDLARQWLPRPLLSLIHQAVRNKEGGLLRKARTLTGSALSDPGRAFYQTNSFIDDGVLQALLAPSLSAACRGYDPAEQTLRYWDKVRGADHVTCMLYTDLKSYLPGDILVKVDRMSMAHSLEVRAPLLDYRVIEYAASLPSRLKIRRGEKKVVLKRAFEKILPQGILHRRKHGFTVPLDAWFRGDLRELGAQVLFDPRSMGHYFDLHRLRKLWDAHQARKLNQGTLLWSLLSFALWERRYISRVPMENHDSHPIAEVV